MNDFVSRARSWLDSTYGDLVVLADTEPVRASERAVLFGCRYTQDRDPMLAATICVPTDGRSPFPVANAAPLDEETNLALPVGAQDQWRWRVNARGCVIAADAAVDGHPASARAWQPADESPGWWDRLLSAHFPSAEVAACGTWSQVGKAIVDGGPGTRGVVWLRRHLGGRELTGHLLYAQYDEKTEKAILLDPQRGSLATVDDREVADLVLARFHRPSVPVGRHAVLPWEEPADDFLAAVAKATSWLDYLYRGEATLVAPDAADETQRGWLFACTTTRFLETGDWRDQMLDAAVLVPKARGESPFGLPNRDPWTWLRDWDAGATGLPAPPAAEPGAPAWFGSLSDQVGGLRGANPHPHWAGALGEVNDLPTDSLALIWLRRKDGRDRESVGHLLWAVNRGDEVHVFDPTADADAPPVGDDLFELRVFRVETPTGAI